MKPDHTLKQSSAQRFEDRARKQAFRRLQEEVHTIARGGSMVGLEEAKVLSMPKYTCFGRIQVSKEGAMRLMLKE
jgi:hypothetical protein